MADPYGIGGATSAASPKPPRWDDWNRQRRLSWRGRQGAYGMGDLSHAPVVPAPAASLPAVPGGNPTRGSYYSPGFSYGGGGPGFFQGPLEGTMLGQMYFNDPRNFGTAYDIATGGSGIGDDTAFGRYVTGQRQNVERLVGAAQTQNPNANVLDLIRSYVGDLRTRYNQLPSLLRGETPRLWGQGELRTILR
jgi:hypothetical protein